MINRYSPFNKALPAVEPDDLSILATVLEGWYVEYKQEVPNASSVAKSISAFANTYGGWIFYGVKEKSKDDAIAGEFPGVASADIDACLQRIRQAVGTHSAPAPYFETHVLRGPCPAINLANDRAVICIRVPWSPTAPHVHKSGQIYRRVADGSEPRPETDRFILDQLWRRGNKHRKEVRRWVTRELDFADGEKNTGYLQLHIVPDLWQDRGLSGNFSLEDARSILGDGAGVITALPFDTVYRAATCFIGRQAVGNDPHWLGLTWRLYPDASSEVIIPLDIWHYRNPSSVSKRLDGYENSKRFINILESHGFRTTRVIDLNILFNVLMGVIDKQDRLLTQVGWTEGYHCKARLLHVWRTCAFIDLPEILSNYESHGVPMCLDREVLCPPGADPEDFDLIGRMDDVGNDQARVFAKALRLFGMIAPAFGIPNWIDATSDEAPPYYEALRAAGARAVDVRRKNAANTDVWEALDLY